MKALLKTVGRFIAALDDAGCPFEPLESYENDDCPEELHVVAPNGTRTLIFVGDDQEHDEWQVHINCIVKLPGVDLHELAASVFGPPCRTFDHGVTNYEPKVGRVTVLVVVGSDSVEFSQAYKKN